MIIAVNTRLLLPNRLEGIGTFAHESLKRITQTHTEHQFVFFFDRPYAPEFIYGSNITPVVVSPPTRHPSLWYLWFEWQLPRLLKKHGADLFLSPDGYLSLRSPVKQLPVIHDINFAHRPRDLKKAHALYYNHFFPRFARKASRIATVSRFSKDDIARTYGIGPEKIDVVYNGVNSCYQPASMAEQEATRRKYTAGQAYFLYVGSLHPRKNIDGLLRAYERFRQQSNRPVKLVIAGAAMFKTGTIRSTLEQMHHRDEVIFTGRLSDQELQQVLGAALALTFVPFFEGFGIPVIEAMSAGTPVICSNTSSLPEVAGKAALFVDPQQEAQIAEAMTRLAGDEALRQQFITAGNQQHQKYSWDQTAELLWQSVEKCL